MIVLLLCFLGGEKFSPFFICVKTNLSWQGLKWGCQVKFKYPSGSTK